MNIVEARNILIKGLHEYLLGSASEKIPLYRSGQTNEEQKLPYVIYSIMNDKGNGRTRGHYNVEAAGEKAEEIRQEQVSATMSLTVCSENRTEGETYIFGEDEAQELAEKCQGWFLHAGYDYLSQNNIVIADITGIQNRNMLLLNEEVSRKGFDVIFNYIAEDKRSIAVVNKVNIKEAENE